MPGTDDIYTIGVEAELTKVTGMAAVTKSIQKAYDKARIDPRDLKAFEKSMAATSKTFYDTIGNARAAGLLKDADALERKMASVQDSIIRGSEQAASIQMRIQEGVAESEKKVLADRIRTIKEGIKVQEAALEKEAKQIQERAERRGEGMEQIEGFLGMSPDEKAKAGLGIAEGFLDNLDRVDPSDMAGMAKGLLQGMGKGGGLLEALGGKIAAGATTGGGAAAGGGLASIGAAAASLAAVAGVLAGIVALLVKADKQTKDWNKTLLDGAGAADLAFDASDRGINELNSSLEAARKSAIRMSFQFREQPEEILEIISKANEMGLTFHEIESQLGKAGDKMSAYVELTRLALVYSKTLGVSQADIAEQTAVWMHDLGGGLKTVEEGFSTIFQAAMVSGVGVKRFFGFVTQATAGLAMYNVRIEEAAALIGELGEALGEAEAAEFVRGLAKGFADRSYTERFKTIIIAGQKDVSEIMGRSADNTARAFTEKFKGLPAETQKQMKAALQGAKGISITEEGKLAIDTRALAGMGEKELRKVVTDVRGADAAMGRQLETMIRLSKGVEGGLGEQAKAMDELDMGGKLALMLQTLGDQPLSELSAIQLAAFENYAGISGEQLKELRRVDSQLRGNYEKLERLRKEAKEGREFTVAEQKAQMEELGGYINEQGQIVAGSYSKESNRMIDSMNLDELGDFIQAQGPALANAVKEPMSAQEAMAKQIVKNTTSITALMETVVKAGFEELAGLLQAIYDRTMGIPADLREERAKLVDSLQGIREQLAETQEEAYAALAEAEQKRDTAKTAEERTAAQKEVETIQADIAAREQTMATTEEDIRRIQTAGGAQLTIAGAKGFGTGVVTQDYGAAEKAAYGHLGVDISAYKEGGAVQEGLMSPTERKRMEEETLISALSQEVSEPLSEYTGEMTDGMKDEFSDLQRHYPDLTAEGYLKALRKKEITDIATMLYQTPEVAQELVQRIEEGGRLTEQQMSRLAGMMSEYEASRVAALYGPGNWVAPVQEPAYPGAEEYPESPYDDFIYRGDAGGGTITPFNRADDLLGMKAGGAIGRALGMAGGPSSVTININGGDTAQIYNVVKKAMRESGVRPAPGGRTVP